MVKEFKICLKNVGRRGNNEKKETINDEGKQSHTVIYP